MFAIGEVVVLNKDGERQVGEVVGVIEVSSRLYYDISLEQVVVKAVNQDDLTPVGSYELKNLLTAMLSGNPLPLSPRDAVLRHRHIAFLTQALSSMEQCESMDGGESSYCVGDVIVACKNDTYELGTVRGISKHNGEVLYEMEIVGDVVRCKEQDIVSLEHARKKAGPLLGSRMRLAVPGHEDDDAYLGVVCMVERVNENDEYSIMFDDGDVLGGLASSDLIPFTISDKDGVVSQ